MELNALPQGAQPPSDGMWIRLGSVAFGDGSIAAIYAPYDQFAHMKSAALYNQGQRIPSTPEFPRDAGELTIATKLRQWAFEYSEDRSGNASSFDLRIKNADKLLAWVTGVPGSAEPK